MTRLGLYNSSEMVLQSALEEDVDVRDVKNVRDVGNVGDVKNVRDVYFLSGAHSTLTPNIADKMSGSVNHYYERRRE